MANYNEHVAEANITAPAHNQRELHGARSDKKWRVWAMFSFGMVRAKHPSNKNAIATSAPW